MPWERERMSCVLVDEREAMHYYFLVASCIYSESPPLLSLSFHHFFKKSISSLKMPIVSKGTLYSLKRSLSHFPYMPNVFQMSALYSLQTSTLGHTTFWYTRHYLSLDCSWGCLVLNAGITSYISWRKPWLHVFFIYWKKLGALVGLSYIENN